MFCVGGPGVVVVVAGGPHDLPCLSDVCSPAIIKTLILISRLGHRDSHTPAVASTWTVIRAFIAHGNNNDMTYGRPSLSRSSELPKRFRRSLVLCHPQYVEAHSLGQRPALSCSKQNSQPHSITPETSVLTDGHDVANLDTESGRNVR